MATIKHKKVSAKTDSADATIIQPSDWNDGHDLTLGADENFVTDAEKIVIGNTSGTNTGDQVESDPVFLASEAALFDVGDKSKLDNIEAGAEVNNISDINATDLTDGGETTLHSHDHGAINGLSDDDHTQYGLLAGRSGGQTLYGGTGASENLTLASTANATKGKILFGTSAYDEVNNRLGIGTTSPDYALDVFNNSIYINKSFLRINYEGKAGALTCALAGLGAGNVNNGTHYYKVTFITASGETYGGTVSAVVTVADNTTNGQVALSAIPTGTAGVVTARKIYRSKAGGSTTGAFSLLTTINDNTTTTYTDNTADSSLTVPVAIHNSTAGFILPSGYPLNMFVGSGGGFNIIADGAYPSFSGVSYSNTAWQGTYFTALRCRGSKAIPLAAANNDVMFSLYAAAYDGVGVLTGIETTKILFEVDGTVSTGVIPSRQSFWTTNTSGLQLERMRINSSGNVGIGTTAPGAQLQVNAGAAATIGTIIKGYASQSANLLEIQNSAGTVLAGFGSDGVARIATKTPASAGATGTTGMIAWDASYIYVCTATNQWKRVAISTW